jgi:hypothetical protein
MTSETAGFPPDSLPEAPKSSGLASFSLEKVENTSKYDLNSMSQADLLALHSKVEGKLKGLRLSEVNLEKETLIQFQKAKALQEKANAASDVPVNQLAQVQNSIRTILESLSKMQMELHSSEEIKRWKAALIRVVKELPKETQTKFFDLLETEAQAVEQELQSTEDA